MREVKIYNMKNVLDFIEAQLLKTKTHLSNTKESNVLFSYWMGYGVALTELKREILNEAVVCGSKETDNCQHTNWGYKSQGFDMSRICIDCKKELSVDGKEISS